DEVAGAVVTVLRHETRYVFVSLPGRVTMTSSTSPYSTACLPVRKRSRSVSFSIFFKLCPVCFTRMLFICSRSRMISRAWMSISVAWPCTPPSGWWIMMRACGSAKRLLLAPAASSQAAMLAQPDDLARLDVDIGGLALHAAERLVDHDAGVREREALALAPRREQPGGHAGRLPDAQGRHLGLDVLHGVVDREAGGHRAPRRVD